MADLFVSTLIQGLIYALVSFGVYITYSILDFPDLGVDGTFPLGAAVTALLLIKGVDPWLTLVISLLVGALAGLFTGVVHVRLKVRDLLSGITSDTAPVPEARTDDYYKKRPCKDLAVCAAEILERKLEERKAQDLEKNGQK